MKMESFEHNSLNNNIFPAHGRVKQRFTLIELLVVTSQLCRDFFKRFICTDQYGCVRKHTESAAHKNTPHHTCKASASCLPQANASCTAHNSCFASAKTFSLFLKRREGCGERGKTSFPGKRSFSSLPAPLSPFQEKRKSFC